MPHFLRPTDAREADRRGVGNQERSTRLATEGLDGTVELVPAETLDSFEQALRDHPEVVQRMEAVIADPSTAVSSRHHPPSAGE